MILDLCPHCGQPMKSDKGRLTPRELDVLIAWWMTGSVQKSAARVGVGEQRAKNLLHRARIRNRVHSNKELLTANFALVRSTVDARMGHNNGASEAA